MRRYRERIHAAVRRAGTIGDPEEAGIWLRFASQPASRRVYPCRQRAAYRVAATLPRRLMPARISACGNPGQPRRKRNSVALSSSR